MKVYEEFEAYELHEVYESHEGFEPHEVHEDHHGNEDDSQALTATLHVFVFVRMVFTTMPFKTSSVRRPLTPSPASTVMGIDNPYTAISRHSCIAS